MEPQQEILNYPELVGGAFSGTALVDEEQKLRLFFTRHIGKRRDRTAFREYQVMDGEPGRPELGAGEPDY